MSFSRKDKLDVVKASPDAVNAKDSKRWVDLFSSFCMVEDPVGSSPHFGGIFDRRSGVRGHGAIQRFFKTFIEPNAITFHVEHDMVCGDEVVRDLTIEITMAADVTVKVPMHLLYELTEEQEQLKIKRLAAYWQLLPMIKQLLALGVPAIPVLLALSWRMLTVQGIGGMVGFSKGFLGAGEKGREKVHQFFLSVNQKQSTELVTLLASVNTPIEFPVGGEVLTAEQLLKKDIKLLPAKLLIAGYSATASCELVIDGAAQPAVIIFEFNRKTKLFEKIRFFLDEQSSANDGAAEEDLAIK